MERLEPQEVNQAEASSEDNLVMQFRSAIGKSGKLSMAEEGYCWAIDKGYGTYVADLMYMEGKGQHLLAGERAYLEAKWEGIDDDKAIELAQKAEVEAQEHMNSLSGNLDQAISSFRKKVFDDHTGIA